MWAGSIAALTQCYSTRGLGDCGRTSDFQCHLQPFKCCIYFSRLRRWYFERSDTRAGEYDKAKKNAYSLMKFAGVICVGLTILLVSISGVFPNLYDTTSQVRNYGTWFIIITALFFPVQGVLNALYFTVRSGEKHLSRFCLTVCIRGLYRFRLRRYYATTQVFPFWAYMRLYRQQI